MDRETHTSNKSMTLEGCGTFEGLAGTRVPFSRFRLQSIFMVEQSGGGLPGRWATRKSRDARLIFPSHLGPEELSRLAPVFMSLKDQSDAITGFLGAIDMTKVDKLVKRDMALTDRVMNVFFKEASIVSVQPIVVFDIARMTGPPSSSEPLGVRFSIGGGIRLQLLRAVNFMAGYAANPRKRPLESPGALFFALDFLDLFR